MPTALQGELRDLLENNPLGVAIMRHESDEEGGVTARRIFANDALRVLFGAETMQELVRHPVLESWVDVSALKHVNSAFAARTPLSGFEAERVRPDGSRFWVSMTGQPIILDGEELTIVWHLDITDRKQAEKNLRDSEAQIRDYMASSVDWLWEMDADLRFTYLSSNIERIAGIEPEKQYGKTRRDLLGPNHDQALWDAHFAALEAREAFRDFVYPQQTDNGELRWVSVSGKPIFSDQGVFLGYRGTGNDVTARVENQELRSVSRAKSEFLSQMSHELRTPLNGILGFSQILENDRVNPLTARQQLAVSQIQRGGTHLLTLINQVLDMAAIENRTFKPSLEPVATRDIIDDCLGMVEVMAAENSIRVTGPPSNADLPRFVTADRTRLRQVLLNLLSNAIKYNVPGGSVTLRCAPSPAGTIRFEVTDTGPGIPARYHDKLFTPFSRFSTQRADVVGTGIGLSITRDLVELMNGTIDFSSEEGRGSSFWITLPSATGVEIASTRDTREPGQKQADRDRAGTDAFNDLSIPNARILHVEDNPTNARLMEMIVEEVDALTLDIAGTAEAGIEQIDRLPPDAVLMDLNLPGISGVEALRILRVDPKTRDIPVIAVSANAMPEDIEAARAAGFDSYVTKPFDIRDLLATLGEVLNKDSTGGKAETVTETSRAVSADYAPLAASDIERLLTTARTLPPAYVSILRSQAASIPELISELRLARANNAPTEIETAAHKLKSQAATFGARTVRDLASRIEKLAQSGDLSDIAAITHRLEDEHAAIAPIVARLLDDIENT